MLHDAVASAQQCVEKHKNSYTNARTLAVVAYLEALSSGLLQVVNQLLCLYIYS